MTKLSMHTWWAGVVLAMACASCKVGATASTTPMTGGGGATANGGGVSAGAASCAAPANHCLEADDLLVSEPFESGYVAAQVGKQTAPPNAAGESTFMILADGSTKTSRVAYRSHRAAPEELVIGTLIAALDVVHDDVYRPPASREDAIQHSWFVARIVSLDPMSQGHVVVSGGYRVALDNVRIVEGDQGPRVQAPGPEDKWFVKPEHWMLGDGALPADGYVSARLALAIQPPSAATRDEGEFLVVQNGERKWSKHAWRTRPAVPADLKLGAHVIAFDAVGGDGVYRAPTNRGETLSGNWFVAKVTDTSESFKGVVTVSGGYRVQVAALRVPVK